MNEHEKNREAKSVISPEDAKRQLNRWMGIGMIGRVREIFQQYNVPEAVLNDPDILWKLRVWKRWLRTDLPSTSDTETPAETLEFLDSTFPAIEEQQEE